MSTLRLISTDRPVPNRILVGGRFGHPTDVAIPRWAPTGSRDRIYILSHSVQANKPALTVDTGATLLASPQNPMPLVATANGSVANGANAYAGCRRQRPAIGDVRQSRGRSDLHREQFDRAGSARDHAQDGRERLWYGRQGGETVRASHVGGPLRSRASPKMPMTSRGLRTGTAGTAGYSTTVCVPI